MKAAPTQTKTRRTVSWILTLLMLAACGGMLAATVGQNWKDLYRSAIYHSRYDAFLPQDRTPNLLDKISARLSSLDSAFTADLVLSEELGQANATLQYAIGKRLVSTGSAQMVRLNGGYLYDLQEEQSMRSAAEEILSLRDTLPEGLPFLFVYEHPTLYDPDMLPPGYEVLDYGEEAADEVTTLLRERGVEVLDSRQVLTDSGVPLRDLLLRTDQHWTTLAALVMSREIAGWARDQGLPLDPELLDVENFDSETFPALFLGKYGQRIGVQNVRPDDITVFWPSYETSIQRHTEKQKSREDVSGDFRTAVIRWDKLEPGEGGWNKKAYFDYGLTEKMESFTNPEAPDRTVLLFKDSYSAPIGAFLSLTARHVYSVDLRQADRPALEYVEALQPDALVIAYSQQMLRDRDYAFVD